jgi:hypothetical protein
MYLVCKLVQEELLLYELRVGMRLLPTDTLRGEGQGYHKVNELSVMHNNSTSLFALFREPHGRTTHNTTQQLYLTSPLPSSSVEVAAGVHITHHETTTKDNPATSSKYIISGRKTRQKYLLSFL